MANETILNGRYSLVAQQGSGGMSVIYKAIDRALGRTVAIKILRPSLTKDPSFLEKFRNEARAVANLSHPNIVTVHDVGSDGITHYIVMEMVEGQDLKKIIKANGALSIERVLNLGIQICAGAGYAHRSGLVHADIKPQNILVTPQDVVKVTDFGIAQALTDTQPLTRNEVVWGSPHYFAPEQARGEQPTPASDVYAIGIVLFEMLTGQLPYNGTNQQELALAHIREAVPRVTDFNPRVPDSLSNIVYKVMSKEPHGRYREGDQLGSVLRKYRDRAQDHTALNQQRVYPATPPLPPEERPRPAAPNLPEPTPHAYQPTVPTPLEGDRTPVQRPQPLQQRYTVPRPSLSNAPAANAGYAAPIPQADYNSYPAAPAVTNLPTGGRPIEYSSGMPPQGRGANRGQNEGFDFVTLFLGILALVMVLGVVALWVYIFASA